MRRIFLITSLVTVIFAVWAVSAFGCIVESNPVVCAPPGNANSHASNQQQRASLPDNKGTQNAEEHSPAIQEGCFN
jgi:hypothetical protein